MSTKIESGISSYAPQREISGDYPNSVYLRALLEIKSLGNHTLLKLLKNFESPAALWRADAVALKPFLKPAKIEAFLVRQAKGLDDGWLEAYQNVGVQVVAITDKAYPPLLKEIHNAPVLLYARGDLTCLQGRTLAFVGTRKASEYGRQSTEKLITEMHDSKPVIVSGLAAGIDTCAHWAAIQAGLCTVAVFGCGLDIVTPVTNQKLVPKILSSGGVLISEYPLGLQPDKTTFPQRNRIIAGLSHGVVVVEGNVKSGALITARLSVEEGRSVYAVPGNLFSPGSQGPHYLIKNGAIPVTEGAEILNDLIWWQSGKGEPADSNRSDIHLKARNDDLTSFADLSDEERQLVKAVSFDAMPIEDLQRATGFASAKINELLTLLELEGLIVLLPGAKVCRK